MTGSVPEKFNNRYHDRGIYIKKDENTFEKCGLKTLECFYAHNLIEFLLIIKFEAHDTKMSFPFSIYSPYLVS